MAMLTENDVINMRFKEPARVEEGYNQDEVDYFLDEVAETIQQLTKDKADLEAQLQAAQARITELETAAGAAAEGAEQAPTDAHQTAAFAPVQTTEPANSAAGMLALAQRLHDEYIADGKTESERMISEAEAERTRIVTEAEDLHNRTLAKLEEERSLMERKINDLREFERDYRTRLKSYLESLLNNVESSNNQI